LIAEDSARSLWVAIVEDEDANIEQRKRAEVPT